MNCSSLLNALPVISVDSGAKIIYVSPKLRTTMPGLESAFEKSLNAHTSASKETILLNVKSDTEEGAELSYNLTPFATDNDATIYIASLAQSTQATRERNLETLGQLAAGVAHEINTPLQYITDNNQFVADSLSQFLKIVSQEKVSTSIIPQTEADYIIEELPRAVAQSLEGLSQVTEIVNALKEFSHQSNEKILGSVNSIVRRAATLTRNEWKYHSKLELELADSLPQIKIQAGELCQAVVNLIINSAHAIQEVGAQRGNVGRIRIVTKHVDEAIVIEISDNGSGIDDKIKDKIFEAFFTTKPIGRGTGQGLSQVKNCIERIHKGMIHFDSQAGTGTIFTLAIPIDQE